MEWVVLDLETTGLDPQSDLILEVGAIHVGAHDLEIQRFEHWVVNHSPGYLDEILGPFVRKMHEDNGLLKEIYALERAANPSKAHAETDDRLLRFFQETGAPKRGIMLAGNSVHFDAAFIKKHLPQSAEYLHHRIIDASCLRECYRVWVKEPETELKAHRAIDYCQMSLRTLRWMARNVFMNNSIASGTST
jgi:oligoribonuclease